MYCQKCRTPLRADASLEDLNPGAFDLLVGSAAKSGHNAVSSARLNYPAERKELYDRASRQAGPPLHKRTIPAPQTRQDGTKQVSEQPGAPEMSFIEVTQSQIVPPSQPAKTNAQIRKDRLDETLKTKQSGDDTSVPATLLKHEKLYEILSSHSDIDHPICSECTSLLLQSYTARLASVTHERDSYAGFLKQLQQSTASSTGDEDDARVEKELAELQREDEETYQELLELEKQKAQLEADLADLEDESRALDEEERGFWASQNAFEDELYALNTDLAALQLKYIHDEQQLEKLQRTNVYNDTFCIGHDGSFATINNLRLGRLSGHNVEWAEINAAWGQTLLLLATVAERLGYEFQGYRLKPMGSTSRIEKIEYPQTAPSSSQGSSAAGPPRSKTMPSASQPKITPFDLFSSGETALGRLLNYQKFDDGLTAFLDCLAQLGDHVDKLPSGDNSKRPAVGRTISTRSNMPKAVFPYKIQGDKIGNDKAGYASIKLGVGFQQQRDENFTRACKYALTCCKFLLAHLSALDGPVS